MVLAIIFSEKLKTFKQQYKIYVTFSSSASFYNVTTSSNIEFSGNNCNMCKEGSGYPSEWLAHSS